MAVFPSLRSTVCTLVVVLGLVCANEEYEAFRRKYGRTRGSVRELKMREGIFNRVNAIIKSTNAAAKAGKLKHTLELNKFADWTEEEIQAMLPPLKVDKGTAKRHLPSHHHQSRHARQTANTYNDWTITGLVPPVRDQGSCGSCWAFSSTDCAAYYYARANNFANATTLSPQEIVDCAGSFAGPSPDDANGCDGGHARWAFSYIQAKKIERDADYPYVSRYAGSCQQVASKALPVWTDTTVSSTAQAGTSGDENAMAAYLGTTGPAVVYFYAPRCAQFMMYKSGILENVCSLPGCNCYVKGYDYNHAVFAVGYLLNNADGTPYYRIKNSWGADWGENGYFRMKALVNEMNIASAGAMYPVGIGAAAPRPTTAPAAASSSAASYGRNVTGMPACQASATAFTCKSGCSDSGACCTSAATCQSGVCDTQSGSSICLETCAADPGCSRSHSACYSYTGPFTTASCVGGVCACSKQSVFSNSSTQAATTTPAAPVLCTTTSGYSCRTGCNDVGACCSHWSACFSGVCDNQAGASICLQSCAADPGCVKSSSACFSYTGPFSTASCVNGVCNCSKPSSSS